MAKGCPGKIVRLFFASVCLAVVSGTTGFAQTSIVAGASERSVPPESDSEAEPGDYNGQDITRPENRFDVRPQYRTGSQPDSRTVQGRTLLRVTSRLGLGARWRLGLLAEVPLVVQKTTTWDPPRSMSVFGSGDAAFQAYLAYDIDSFWAFAFGARVEAPTAPRSLGTRQWQVMPGVGVRYSFLQLGSDTYFVPVVRYAIGLSDDPAKPAMSQAQIAPTLNIGLTDRWFLTLFPSYDVRINFGTPLPGQTGRLFLPFDVAFGRDVGNGATVSLEISVPIIRDFPVYDFKTELRVSARF